MSKWGEIGEIPIIIEIKMKNDLDFTCHPIYNGYLKNIRNNVPGYLKYRKKHMLVFLVIACRLVLVSKSFGMIIIIPRVNLLRGTIMREK